jgi:hypothetical protein
MAAHGAEGESERLPSDHNRINLLEGGLDPTPIPAPAIEDAQ